MQTQMVEQLALCHEAIKNVASLDPHLASGAEKALQGIREMQTALVANPQSTPINHRLIPSLEINIPMPAGAAVPRSPQSTPVQTHQAEPAQTAGAQSR
jgi:hypothetical protein